VSNGDTRSMLPNKVTALNPNAAEFVPSFIRPSFESSAVSDVSKADLKGSGKTILDRSESSKSNNSDDEAHQFWRKQLPDDIIPDFSFEKIEQEPEELSLAGLSLNAPPFYGTTASRFSREHDLSSQANKSLELGHTSLLYEDNSQASFPTMGSSNWEQSFVGDLHFTNGDQALHYDPESAAGFSDSFASEYAAATDGVLDPLEYLASQFPGFSAESLAELYYANGCDFNHTIEILTQLEMQVDATSNQTLTPRTPNFSTGDFPALPTVEDQNGFSKGNADILSIFNGRSSPSVSSGTGDFVSAVRKLASQNSGNWKYKKGPEYGNCVSTVSVPKQYSSTAKTSSGNKFQNVSSVRAAPWLETGDAVANMYSESREEARDFARIRNACFEQARQAYLIGNKALAKELSMKGQTYNIQMKAAHEKAREAIYRQRNPASSQRGSDRLIDLHGLHVNEAIHILKVELGALKSTARATGRDGARKYLVARLPAQTPQRYHLHSHLHLHARVIHLHPMPLMAVASQPFFSSSTSNSTSRHIRRATIATAAASSAPDDFDYPLADPSVRWPHLRFPHLPAPRFPAATAAPPAPVARPSEGEEEPAEEAGTSSAAALEPLDARAHRGRVKKLSKLALRRARDWRARIAGVADRVLALPPGAPVGDVLDDARLAPDELAIVVRAVGAASWRRALDAFEWLVASGGRAQGPRVVAVVLGVLGRASQDALAEEVFLRFAREGATVQVFNAMMGVYARSGRFDDVRQLLDAMRDQDIEPDLVSFNTLINARAKSGCLAAGGALKLLHEVRQAGLRPDAITYNTLISACSQGSNLDDAVALFEEMIASECRPDLWTYNAMVSVHGRCGKAQEAERMFKELVEKGFQPDAVTYNSLLYAFAKEGDVDRVERVCEELVKAGFKKDGITYNTMIHMYGKMGRLDLALGLYDEMRAIGCTPDAVTYTVLVDSLGKMDRISEAGKVLEEMADAGLKPTLELQDLDIKISRSTVLLMLEAFAKAGDVFEICLSGIVVLTLMRSNGDITMVFIAHSRDEQMVKIAYFTLHDTLWDGIIQNNPSRMSMR
ncbi:hypothetical protein E2562_029894, partial [Oryza meyeriana var. granulata]